MTKHRSPDEFEQPARPPCRVAEMARRFGVAAKQWDKLGGDHAAAAEATNEAIMDALQNAAAVEQSMSAEGALFQVLVAAQIADLLHSHVGGDSEGAKRQALNDSIRLDRALWSIRRFLEAHFGIPADGIGGDYLMPEGASYLGKLKAAIAEAGKQPASGPRLHVAN